MPSAEKDAACQSLSNVVPFGSDGRLRCLLFSPHDGYRHYAAMPDDWRRFWFWDDGDSVFPPGEGKASGCTCGGVGSGCTCGIDTRVFPPE